MDVRLHERAQRRVDEAVALNTALSFEVIGNDRHFEMSHSIPGARMPGVEVALVLHLEMGRGKARLEPLRINSTRSAVMAGPA